MLLAIVTSETVIKAKLDKLDLRRKLVVKKVQGIGDGIWLRG